MPSNKLLVKDAYANPVPHDQACVDPYRGRNRSNEVRAGLIVSYLALYEINGGFSEYVLYEPVLRILTVQGDEGECESECSDIDQQATWHKRY